jgi:hypothetical protein
MMQSGDFEPIAFRSLNAFERSVGLPATELNSLHWIHDLQAAREARLDASTADPYRQVLTPDRARHGPWPSGLLTGEARTRLERLYAHDIHLYGDAVGATHGTLSSASGGASAGRMVFGAGTSDICALRGGALP